MFAQAPSKPYKWAMRHRDRLPEILQRRHPLIATAARRPVALFVLIAATLIIGSIALTRIPLAAFPPGFESRDVNVEAGLRTQGARLSPEEVEKRLTLPMEGELATIPGVQSLKASSNRDGFDFDISFAPDADLKEAFAQVRDRVERAKAKIGSEIDNVRISRQQGFGRGGGGSSVASLSITWGPEVVNPWDKFNNRVKPAIEGTDGIASMRVWGEEQLYYRVALNQQKLAAHPDVDVRKLRAALSGDNFSSPAGKLSGGESETYVVINSKFTGLDELRGFPVSATLKLADIADVREARSAGSQVWNYGWDADNGAYKGGRGVYCPINKTSDSNIVTTGLNLKETVQHLREDPNLKGFSFVMASNQADDILTQLATLQDTLLTGGILAVLVLLLFLKRFRLALIISLAMPLSMTMALVVMYFAGESLSLIALMGFTVAAGMLLDNAIVVSENIYRRMAIDRMPFQAAVIGASEVGLAITLATSTTVVVFLAFAFFSDSPFGSFIMARLGFPICFSLAFSILVALAIIPWTMSHTYGSKKESRLRAMYYRLMTPVWKLPQPVRLVALPVTILFGRRPDMPAATGLGEWLDGSKYRRFWYGMGFLGGAVIGVLLGWWAFSALGGTDFFGPLGAKAAKLIPSSDAAPSGMGGGMGRGMGGFGAKEASIHPSLVAIAVFALCASLPPIVMLLAPRAKQRFENAPVIARLQAVYGEFVAWLLQRQLVALVYVTATVVILLFVGFSWVGKTEQNQGSKQWLFMQVRFPQNVYVDDGETQVDDMAAAQLPPHIGYMLAVREKLFGVPFGKVPDPAQMAAAYEKYGLARGSISFRTGGMMLFLQLDSGKAGEVSEAEKRIKAAFPEAAGFRVTGGFDSSELSKLRILLRGPEYGALEEQAEKLTRVLEGIEGLSDVSDGKDQVARTGEAVMRVDRQRAAALGVNPETMAMLVAFQINGQRLNDYTQGEVVRPIRVLYDYPETRTGELRNATLEDVRQIRVPKRDGDVRVESVVEQNVISYGGPDSIEREDGQTTLTITATPKGSTDEILPRIQAALDGVGLPPGYSAEVRSGLDMGGGARGGGRRMGGGGGPGNPLGDPYVLVAAALLVWIVMAFLFESITRPVIVLFACVPGAAAGAAWALLFANSMFDNICALGLVVLLGVSVNNGIVYVDLINRLRAEGMELAPAIRQAGEQRLRPMLMTSLTTAAGLVPMAIGKTEFIDIPYSPLAQVILGGMVFSTGVTLVAIPLYYGVVESVSEFFMNLFRLAFGGRKAAS
jgi:multidrug efflux pump subunit AcrB